MIFYSIILKCDHCSAESQVIFGVPVTQADMRDSARNQAKSKGWMTVLESGDKKDYCPACVEKMKMKVSHETQI